MSSAHAAVNGPRKHAKALLGGVLAGTAARPAPPVDSGSACSSPRAGASPAPNAGLLAVAAAAACLTGLEFHPLAGGTAPTQGAGRALPPLRLDLPVGAALGEDALWLVPPSPTAGETHAARTLSMGCGHAGVPPGSAAPACMARAPAKRPRTAATASEVVEQMRRERAAKRLRGAAAAPAPAPTPEPTPEPPTLASLLLDAIHGHWEEVDESELAGQAPAAAVEPCHSTAISAAVPTPNAAAFRHGTAALPPALTGSYATAPMPHAIAQCYIQSFARKLGWVCDGVALRPLY